MNINLTLNQIFCCHQQAERKRQLSLNPSPNLVICPRVVQEIGMIRSSSLSNLEKAQRVMNHQGLREYLPPISNNRQKTQLEKYKQSLLEKIDALFLKNLPSYIEQDACLKQELQAACVSDIEQIKDVLEAFYEKHDLPISPFRLRLLLENPCCMAYINQLIETENHRISERVLDHYQSIFAHLNCATLSPSSEEQHCEHQLKVVPKNNEPRKKIVVFSDTVTEFG